MSLGSFLPSHKGKFLSVAVFQEHRAKVMFNIVTLLIVKVYLWDYMNQPTQEPAGHRFMGKDEQKTPWPLSLGLNLEIRLALRKP